jgi:hypothetical protein
MKMEQSIPKRRHIIFGCRGITQKKAYKITFTPVSWKFMTLCKQVLHTSLHHVCLVLYNVTTAIYKPTKYFAITVQRIQNQGLT